MTVTETGQPARDRTMMIPARRRTMRVPRSRGAVSGFLLVLLGAWGALVPFFGPYLDYSYGTDQTWHWTNARLWLEVLPGAAAAVGGLLLLVSAHRVAASLGGWLAALGGAWFIVGLTLAPLLHLGSVGQPLSTKNDGRAAAQLGYFYGLGAVILFLAAFALGRMAVVGVRDVLVAEREEQRAAEAAAADAELARRRELERDNAERDGVVRDGADRDGLVRDGRLADDDGVVDDERLREDRTRRFDEQNDTRRYDEPVADGAARHGRYEPDRPYDSQSVPDQPTTRYDSGVVGSDYGSAEDGSTSRFPAHQAPGDDRS